jgi:hypothetical protein
VSTVPEVRRVASALNWFADLEAVCVNWIEKHFGGKPAKGNRTPAFSSNAIVHDPKALLGDEAMED